MTDLTRKLTAADFDPEVLRLFDRYVHGAHRPARLPRWRARFAVGGVSAAALLEALSPNFAAAEQVPKTDPRIRRRDPSTSRRRRATAPAAATSRGRRAHRRPGGATTPTTGLPLVLVIHENRGLNPHIEDIARRLARRQLHRLRARCAPSARRLSRRRGQGARYVRQARAGEDARGPASPRRATSRACRAATARSAQSASAGAAAWSICIATRVSRPRRRRAVLRPRAGKRERRRDQRAAAPDVRRQRRFREQDLAAVRGGVEGRRQALRGVSDTRARSTASTTTRRRASTPLPRARPGSARVAFFNKNLRT